MDTSELVAGYTSKLDADARQYIADLAVKQAAIPKAEFELGRLKGEIVRILTGESGFTEAMIKELLLQKEAELLELRNAEDYLQNEIMRIDALKCAQMELNHELNNWSELFDKHDLARRKAMLFHIIDRIDVWEERVEITYNITLNAFSGVENIIENTEHISENAPETLCTSVEKCYTDSCIGVNNYTSPEVTPQVLHIKTKRGVNSSFGERRSWNIIACEKRVQERGNCR